MNPNMVLFILMGVAFAHIFWKAAEFEESRPCMLWAGMSLVVYGFTWLWLGWSMLWLIGAQVGLGGFIAVIRAAIYLRQTSEK
jgi:hypothetical protein